ncbi:MAG: response regulator [Blastocatellia bacterium]|nr:response regulator [Blastocatellia bacterium]
MLMASIACASGLLFLPRGAIGADAPHWADMKSGRLTPVEGLGNRSVRTVIQDSQGFIWIASDSGVDRYDGVRLRHFQIRDVAEPGPAIVVCIVEGPDRSVWVGGRRGTLQRFDRSSNAFRSIPELDVALGDSDVLSLLAGKDGAMWIGTSNGLVRYEPDSGSAQRFIPSTNPVVVTIVESDQTLWVGTSFGLLRFDREDSTFHTVRLSPDVSIPEPTLVSSLVPHSTGVMFAGTREGLFGIDLATGQSNHRIASAGARVRRDHPGAISSMLSIDAETLAISVDRSGIGLLDVGSLAVSWSRGGPRDAAGLGSITAMPALVDRSGVLWIVDLTEGLGRFPLLQNKFRLFRSDPNDARSLSGNYIRGICDAGDGRLWISTQFNGLNLVDVKSGWAKRYQRSTGGLPGDGVFDVLRDQEGVVWAGLIDGQGLARLDPRTNRFLPTPLIGGVDVSDLYEDRHGTLWVGTVSGLFEIPKGRGSAIRHESDFGLGIGRATGNVQSVFVDRHDSLWIGLGGGLHRVERPTGKVVDCSPQLGITDSEILVGGFLETEGGQFWVATKGAGVFRYDRERDDFVRLEPRDGVPHDNTYGILEDRNGRLWISTDAGIVRYDPADGSVEQFGPDLGLQGREFNRRAYFESDDGTMYFGGPDGLNAFRPDAIARSRMPPEIAISEMLVNGIPRAATDSVDLKHDENTVSVEFAVLDYNTPAQHRYLVKLDGVDDDWIDVGSTPQITYAELHPGDYTFRVRGSTGPGVWSEADAAVRFRISASWWRTPWAYSAYSLAAVGLLVGLGGALRYRWITGARLRESAAIARAATIEKEAERKRAVDAEQQSRERAAAEAVIRSKNEQLAMLVEQLTESERAAQAATKAKSQFLAVMSHEMRTPLNAVLGMTHVLLTTELSDKQNELATTIRSSGTALAALIDDVLDLSRVEAGALVLHNGPCDVRVSVRESLDVVAHAAAEKGLELRSSVEDGVPDIVSADGNRIRQVLLNLLSNAVKFTERGWVSIGVSATRAGLDDDGVEGYELRFRVSDSGIGIPPELMGRLFESFSQLDNSTTRRHGGTGLGLAISRQIVEMMGGTISVESDGGSGSTFEVVIPVVTSVDTPALGECTDDSVATSLVAPEPVRVLVADDNAVNRLVLSRLLEPMNCRADLVESGLEALEAVRRRQYDLVLLDVHMPDVDGIDVARRIRNAGGPGRPRIVALTADVLVSTRQACLDAGMDAVLPKPVDPEALQRLLLGDPTATRVPDVRGAVTLDHLSFDRLCEALGLRDDASIAKLLDQFLDSADTSLAAIDQALEEGNWSELLRSAHSLAGSSATLGAARVAAACQQTVNHSSGTVDEMDIRASVERLRLELVELRREIGSRASVEATGF